MAISCLQQIYPHMLEVKLETRQPAVTVVRLKFIKLSTIQQNIFRVCEKLANTGLLYHAQCLEWLLQGACYFSWQLLKEYIMYSIPIHKIHNPP